MRHELQTGSHDLNMCSLLHKSSQPFWQAEFSTVHQAGGGVALKEPCCGLVLRGLLWGWFICSESQQEGIPAARPQSELNLISAFKGGCFQPRARSSSEFKRKREVFKCVLSELVWICVSVSKCVSEFVFVWLCIISVYLHVGMYSCVPTCTQSFEGECVPMCICIVYLCDCMWVSCVFQVNAAVCECVYLYVFAYASTYCHCLAWWGWGFQIQISKSSFVDFISLLYHKQQNSKSILCIYRGILF